MRTLRGCMMAALAVIITAGFVVQEASATLMPNSAVTKTRIFNDCPFSTATVVNNYPASLILREDCPDCGPFGFANLHNWSYSTDGVEGMDVNNNDGFRFGAWVTLSGSTNGEAGLRFSPWWSQDVDGRLNIRVPDGEIACFGGRLPFYSFTANHGINYVGGQPIYLEITYLPNGLSSTDPGTIEYVVGWGGNTYTSGPIPFDEGNPGENPPHGVWGCLNEARVGGYFQPQVNHAGPPALDLQAEFSRIVFEGFPAEVPCPTSAVTKARIFNDCPFSTATVANSYPTSIVLGEDCPDCGPFGFANLHNWTYSSDGSTGMVLNNNMEFRFGSWVTISGTTNGEAGLRLSPWWSQDVDGRMNIRVPDGEIACFGGRLPFYSFTGNHGINYVRGEPIYLEMVYRPNGLNATLPATIEYVVGWGGTTYTSGPLPFDMANPTEDPPHGLWGCLNDARAGGYFQPQVNHAGPPALDLRATFSGIIFSNDFTPPEVTCNVYKMPKAKQWDDDDEDDDHHGRFGNSHGKDKTRKDMYVVDFSVIDDGASCMSGPVTVNAYIDAGCMQIPVTDGQVVKIKCEDDDEDDHGDDHGHYSGHGHGHGNSCPVEVYTRKGYIEIKNAPSASLVVEATDAAGNVATCASPICRAQHMLARQRDSHVLDPAYGEVFEPALIPLSAPKDRTQMVEFRLPDAASVTLDVFDVAGRRVQRLVESFESSGLHRVEWDTSALPNGIYFYQLRSGAIRLTQKVALIH